MEQAGVIELFKQPLHPYTRGLMASIPQPGQTGRVRLKTIPGSVPRLDDLPVGCKFGPRCDIKTARCEVDPDLLEIAPGHLVRCWEAK